MTLLQRPFHGPNKPVIPPVFRRMTFLLQSYLYWFNEYQSEGDYSAISNQVDARLKLEDLLPEALEFFKRDE